MSKTRKIVYNVVFGFGGQFIILLMGIIMPRIMLTNYGSDINGLVNTVGQIFTYMALLEAGIGQATKNALYKPLADKNKDGISYVMSTSRRYYRRITLYYGAAVLVLSLVLPLILKSEVDKLTIFFVVAFEGASGVVSFYYLQNWLMLLIAEGKGYIKANVEMITKFASYILKIVLVYAGFNVAVLQFMYFVISLSKLIYFKWYFKKYYCWIDYEAAPHDAKLKDRNSYVLNEIAWTIFSSTDMIVLSIFVSTKMSSVYSIYNMVFQNLSLLLNAVYGGVVYLLGLEYSRSMEAYQKLHDNFNSVFIGGISILMSVAYFLILPFIQLYTSGITDVKYVYQELPLLFCLVQLLSWGRYVGGNLTGIAGYAKQISKISLIEAIINFSLSIILVPQFGIIGVLCATVVALPLKLIAVTYISDIKVMKRSAMKTIKIIGANFLGFFLIVLLKPIIPVKATNYFQLLGYGAILSVVIFTFFMILNVFVNPQLITYLQKLFCKRNRA